MKIKVYNTGVGWVTIDVEDGFLDLSSNEQHDILDNECRDWEEWRPLDDFERP